MSERRSFGVGAQHHNNSQIQELNNHLNDVEYLPSDDGGSVKARGSPTGGIRKYRQTRKNSQVGAVSQ